MEIREALYGWLSTDPNIAALVGTRIYPNKLPQGSTFPQITFFKVSNPRVRNLSGPDGLSSPRIQIDCWGLTPDSAKDVADAVRTSNIGGHGLDGFRGTMGSVVVQSTNFEDERDTYNPPIDDSDIGTHQVSLDLIVWWNEG